MTRSTVVSIVVVLLVVAFALPMADAAGFGLSMTPSQHEEFGRCNVWIDAVYPDALRASTSWGADQVPEIVFAPDLILRVNWTSDSGNWKSARVGLAGNRRFEVKLHGENRGDIISAEIPISEFGGEAGMQGLCLIIGQKASHRAIISLPLIGDVGKKGQYNEDWGLIRFTLIRPLTGPEMFGPVPELGLSALEAFLLVHNGGTPTIGSVDKDLVRQLVERRLAAGPRFTDPPTDSATVGSAEQVEGVMIETPPPTPAVVTEAPKPVEMEKPEPARDLVIRIEQGSSDEFRLVLPQGISRV